MLQVQLALRLLSAGAQPAAIPKFSPEPEGAQGARPPFGQPRLGARVVLKRAGSRARGDKRSGNRLGPNHRPPSAIRAIWKSI